MKLSKSTCIWAVVLAFFLYVMAEAGEEPKRVADMKEEWGEETEGYTISIATDKENYLPGEMITLSVKLKNMSEGDTKILLVAKFASYQIEVVLPTREQAPLTLYGKKMLEASQSFVRAVVPLKAGEEIGTSFNLNRFFDMTLSGEYRISVSRKVWERDNIEKTATVNSNTVVVVINE